MVMVTASKPTTSVQPSHEVELAELVDELSAHHPPTYDHCRRVASLARQMAIKLGMSRREVCLAFAAGLLHDVGHLATPPEILEQPSPLSDAHWAVVRRHPFIGAQLLGNLSFDPKVVAAILKHHERPDGKGYPAGTRKIDPVTALVSVASTFDTIFYSRWLHSSQGRDQALREIRRVSGTQLDQTAARALHQAAGEPWGDD